MPGELGGIGGGGGGLSGGGGGRGGNRIAPGDMGGMGDDKGGGGLKMKPVGTGHCSKEMHTARWMKQECVEQG